MRFTEVLPAALLLPGAAAQTPGPYSTQSFATKVPDRNTTKTPVKTDTVYYSAATGATVVSTFTDDYVFYCPEPTKFLHRNVTYTVTTPTYLTITNCPCTVTYTQNPQPTYPPVIKTTFRGNKTEVVTYPPTIVPTPPGKPVSPPQPPGKPAVPPVVPVPQPPAAPIYSPLPPGQSAPPPVAPIPQPPGKPVPPPQAPSLPAVAPSQPAPP
ncbi:hypothetical protein FZEAL_9586, partial [Fusarium zealandicum]